MYTASSKKKSRLQARWISKAKVSTLVLPGLRDVADVV